MMPAMRLAVLVALTLSSGTALAAPTIRPDVMSAPVPAHTGRLPTKFEPVANSLQQLLDAGYEIRTSAGDEGAVLFLAKFDAEKHTPQWARCEMLGDNNGNVRLIYSHHPTADCRVLN